MMMQCKTAHQVCRVGREGKGPHAHFSTLFFCVQCEILQSTIVAVKPPLQCLLANLKCQTGRFMCLLNVLHMSVWERIHRRGTPFNLKVPYIKKIKMNYPYISCFSSAWTTPRALDLPSHMQMLLNQPSGSFLGLSTLPKNSSTCGPGEPRIEPLIF